MGRDSPTLHGESSPGHLPKGHSEEGANHTSYATGEQPQCYAGELSPGQSRDPALLQFRHEAAQGTKSAQRQALGLCYQHSSQSSHCLCWRDAALRAWECCSTCGRLAGVHMWVLQFSTQTGISLAMADLAPINSRVSSPQ